MELALICAQQVTVLFLLIGVGTLAVKTGVLKLEAQTAAVQSAGQHRGPGHDRKLLSDGVQP